MPKLTAKVSPMLGFLAVNQALPFAAIELFDRCLLSLE